EQYQRHYEQTVAVGADKGRISDQILIIDPLRHFRQQVQLWTSHFFHRLERRAHHPCQREQEEQRCPDQDGIEQHFGQPEPLKETLPHDLWPVCSEGL